MWRRIILKAWYIPTVAAIGSASYAQLEPQHRQSSQLIDPAPPAPDPEEFTATKAIWEGTKGGVNNDNLENHEDVGNKNYWIDFAKERGFIDIVQCGEVDDKSKYLPLIIHLESIKWTLDSVGMREDLYYPALNDFKIRSIRNIMGLSVPKILTDVFLRKNKSTFISPDANKEFIILAMRLDEVRRKYQPELPPIGGEGGCGAGEVSTRISTLPEGGRIWIATKFDSLVCEKRKIDLADQKRCDIWREINPRQYNALSGEYRYQVVWKDGFRQFGSIFADDEIKEVEGVHNNNLVIERK